MIKCTNGGSIRTAFSTAISCYPALRGSDKMIRDVLLPALQSEFPSRNFRTDDSPIAIGSFPSAHEEVGDVTIWDNGDEATVGIGDITHGHFNTYDENLTQEEIVQRVTQEVLAFLTDLFADRVLLWKSADGGSGGWRILGDDNRYSIMDSNDLTYLGPAPLGILTSMPDNSRVDRSARSSVNGCLESYTRARSRER